MEYGDSPEGQQALAQAEQDAREEHEARFDRVDAVTTEVLHEVLRAMAKFKPFNSAHEGYAVLLEEVDELWGEVKKNQHVRDRPLMRTEAIQCAAMAVRFILDIANDAETAVRSHGDGDTALLVGRARDDQVADLCPGPALRGQSDPRAKGGVGRGLQRDRDL